MSYVAKTNWQYDDTVTEQDLNRIEGGIKQALDEVEKIEVPSASLTKEGITQLSNAIDSNDEGKAATPKAVKDATLQAKSYTDQQINLVTETGIPKLVSYPLKVIATTDNQTVFEIPLDLFDAITDTILVTINRAALDPTQYTVTNTVRDGAGQVTQRAKINLLSGVTATSEVTMVVLKNVPIGPNGTINGAVLDVDSVPINRVSGLSEELADYVKHPGFASTTGTATAYVVTLDPAPTATSEGFGITIVPHVANGANPTLNVNSKGAIALKDQKGVAYATGKLLAGKPYTFRKVGSDFLADSGSGAEGNATANDLRTGKTATVASGDVITGALPVQATTAQTITPGTANVVKPAGIYDGAITILGDPDLVAGNFPNDVNIFNIQGALERMTPAERNAIIAAIVSKGVPATSADSNTVLATKISQIDAVSYADLTYTKSNMTIPANSSVVLDTIFTLPAGTKFVVFIAGPSQNSYLTSYNHFNLFMSIGSGTLIDPLCNLNFFATPNSNAYLSLFSFIIDLGRRRITSTSNISGGGVTISVVTDIPAVYDTSAQQTIRLTSQTTQTTTAIASASLHGRLTYF